MQIPMLTSTRTLLFNKAIQTNNRRKSSNRTKMFALTFPALIMTDHDNNNNNNNNEEGDFLYSRVIICVGFLIDKTLIIQKGCFYVKYGRCLASNPARNSPLVPIPITLFP